MPVALRPRKSSRRVSVCRTAPLLMEIGDQLYLYRQQARHHTSDVASPILADIALTMCVGFYVLWGSASKKPDHTERQSRNQKAGKHILAGMTQDDTGFEQPA